VNTAKLPTEESPELDKPKFEGVAGGTLEGLFGASV
jgi:hypothetical protein